MKLFVLLPVMSLLHEQYQVVNFMYILSLIYSRFGLFLDMDMVCHSEWARTGTDLLILSHMATI
jgi:hypothetical protein